MRPIGSKMLVLFLLSSLPLWGQTPEPRSTPPSGPSQGHPEYRLGSGDLVEVQVFGVESLHLTVRVSASGQISLPLLGSVAASGLTTAELEQRLKTGLHEGEFVYDPQVTVFVKEHHSRSFSVVGAVKEPGKFAIVRPLRLTDAIALAGGIDDETAGRVLLIQRESEGNEARKPIRIELAQLLEEGQRELDLLIQSGDVVNVPERLERLFYVIGEVNRPGVYELPSQSPLRVTQALAWAGGAMKTAKIGKGKLYRVNEEGEAEIVEINLKKIIKGEVQDVAILRDDVLFVPGSTFKNITYGLLGAVPRTVSDAITRVPGRK